MITQEAEKHHETPSQPYPPVQDCPNAYCPNRQRLHRALAMLRDLAVLFDEIDGRVASTVAHPTKGSTPCR
jgi:hypothetical protein